MCVVEKHFLPAAPAPVYGSVKVEPTAETRSCRETSIFHTLTAAAEHCTELWYYLSRKQPAQINREICGADRATEWHMRSKIPETLKQAIQILGSIVWWLVRRTCNRQIASSTPGRRIAG